MKKLVVLLSIPMILFIFIIGCSTDQNPVNADLRASMAPIILPAGATLTSATFNVSIPIGNSQNVNVHRITSDWNEMTVTWITKPKRAPRAAAEFRSSSQPAFTAARASASRAAKDSEASALAAPARSPRRASSDSSRSTAEAAPWRASKVKFSFCR